MTAVATPSVENSYVDSPAGKTNAIARSRQ